MSKNQCWVKKLNFKKFFNYKTHVYVYRCVQSLAFVSFGPVSEVVPLNGML